MALDVYFPEDVARILASTYETMACGTRATAPSRPDLTVAYQQGFFDALRAVGVAFGVAPPSWPQPHSTVPGELPAYRIGQGVDVTTR